jgi:toxin ParE1/3/4
VKKPKPIVLRELVNADARNAGDYYAAEGGEELESRFVDALQAAFRHIARLPATGSLWWAARLGRPGLRAWPLKRFPYLVFYVESEQRIEVWRVLHKRRDVPAAWAENEQSVDE